MNTVKFDVYIYFLYKMSKINVKGVEFEGGEWMQLAQDCEWHDHLELSLYKASALSPEIYIT
jgi:hypothetical protein